MASKPALNPSQKSAGLGLPTNLRVNNAAPANPVTKTALQKLDKLAGKPAGAPASALSAVAIDPTLAKVQATFRKIPTKAPGKLPTDHNITGMCSHFKARVKQLREPSVEHYAITKLARTLLLAPQGLAFALMDRAERGDSSFSSGNFKNYFHGVGLHDGGHYAIGVSHIATCAQNIFKESSPTARKKAIVLLDRETEICNRVSSSPYVQQTVLAFADRGLYYTISLYMPDGNLYDHVETLVENGRTLPFLHRVEIGRKLMEGLEFIHACGIIHRDVKDDNVLLDGLNPKICDFGFATAVNDTSEFGVGRICGTPRFIAPELLLGKPSTFKVDIWSAGVLLHSLLRLDDNMPWDKYDTPAETIQNIPRESTWQLAFDFNFDAEDKPIKELLRKMISVDPKKRPTALEARKAMEAIEGAIRKPSASKTGGDLIDEKEFHAPDKPRRAGSPPRKPDPIEDKERQMAAKGASTYQGDSPSGYTSDADLEKQMDALLARLDAELEES